MIAEDGGNRTGERSAGRVRSRRGTPAVASVGARAAAIPILPLLEHTLVPTPHTAGRRRVIRLPIPSLVLLLSPNAILDSCNMQHT